MHRATTLIRAARLAAGLTQGEVAKRTGIHQPNVARAEAGDRAPSLDTCDRLLRAAGFRITVLPGRGTDAFETASEVREAIRQRNEDRAYRLIIQLADDLHGVHGA